MQSMFLSSSSLRYSRVVGRSGRVISLANVWRPSYRSAAPAHVTPGSWMAVPSSPEPCMPTPTIPKRTVSLGATTRNLSGASETPAAAALASRNSRRDQLEGGRFVMGALRISVEQQLCGHEESVVEATAPD